ncbi:MAG TPA: hypothetical protein PLN58_06455 [Bacilli bacterium]|jgi:hypothetical protein|nr:hypothetical protein [Bacilli bacterium]
MNKPNIFNYAYPELSQDAFICWLLNWGNPEYLAINEDLHDLSHKLIKAFFDKHSRKLPARIEKIETIMGYLHIDIILIINGCIIIPVQDKIYNRESPAQLAQYLQLLKEDGYDVQKMLPIYLQTGAQANHKRLKESGFLPFSGKELMDILNRGEHIKNDILKDFITHLRELENLTKSFLERSLNKWHLYSWHGFYDYFQDKLGDGEWDAVSGPINSFLAFWWHWHNEKDCALYLQLEKADLCYKIIYKEKQVELKREWRDRFFKAAEGSSLKLVDPICQKDNAITVAIVEGDYRRTSKNGKIDLKKTLDVIKEAQNIYDQAIINIL